MIVPKHSELSAAGHDEATVTVGTGGGPPGGGVGAAGIGRRRHHRQQRLQKQRCGGRTCVSMHLPAPNLILLSEPTDHCIIPSLKPSVAPRPPIPGFSPSY